MKNGIPGPKAQDVRRRRAMARVATLVRRVSPACIAVLALLVLVMAGQGLASADPGAPGSGEPSAARPQTPQPPFPYAAEDVRVPNPGAGITLAGTLFIPEGHGPFPAALLVTGSGPQDRDETLFGHKPFLVLADYLARKGIATLRCDDRGVGASEGNFALATTFDFAKDAEAALDWLASRPEIRAEGVGVIGHSEGGIVASIIASRRPGLGFAVLLAGPGLSGEEILYLQNAAIARASGMGEEAIAKANEVNSKLYAIAKREGDTGVRREELASILEAFMGGKPDDPADLKAARRAQVLPMADSLLVPWFGVFLATDPASYLREAKAPVLALIGSKDLQVPPKENLEAIRNALASSRGGDGHSMAVELEGLNHLFQRTTTGLPAEYGFLPETFAPAALEVVGNWLAAVLGLE